VQPLDVALVVEGFRPKSYVLSEIAEEYLSLRDINERPSRLALAAFLAVAGDREVRDYRREDAKLFVHHLTKKGNKTATVRRRINSMSAILNYAYSELDVDKRNPFSRLLIQGEGQDSKTRGTFTTDQLLRGYEQSLAGCNTLRLLFPILGETGCRLAEVVGLMKSDINWHDQILHIRPNDKRRLKTPSSERSIPLTPTALKALKLVTSGTDSDWLFPRYIKEDGCYATHASNALRGWMHREWGLTAHSLRHTFRDRLRAAEVPVEVIDQLGGWSSGLNAGSKYGAGYSMEHLRKFMDRVALSCETPSVTQSLVSL
jgi:integrase